MKKVIVVIAILTLFLSGCVRFPSRRGPLIGKAEKIPIPKGVNPIYVFTDQKLYLIDSKTDKYIKSGSLGYVQPDEVHSSYKNYLISSFWGSDFPNTDQNTYLWNLNTGQVKHLSGNSANRVFSKANIIIGTEPTGGNLISWIYQIEKGKMIKKPVEYSYFFGFLKYQDKECVLVGENMDALSIRQLDNFKELKKIRKKHTVALITDNNTIAVIHRSQLTSLDINTLETKKYSVKVPDFFYALTNNGKVYIAKSNADQIVTTPTSLQTIDLKTGNTKKKITFKGSIEKVEKAGNDLIIYYYVSKSENSQSGTKIAILSKDSITYIKDLEDRIAYQDMKFYRLTEDQKVEVYKGKTKIKSIKLDIDGTVMGIFPSEPVANVPFQTF